VRVRVAETYHVVYYAPYYVASRLRLFEREGVEVTGTRYGSNPAARAAFDHGEADIGIGGIMRSLVAFDRGEPIVPVHVARINDRDGFLLLGRSAEFDWPDLIGRRLIVFAEAPTPVSILRAHLLTKGLAAGDVQVIDDVPLGAVAAEFRAGTSDFVLTQAHVAEDLLRSGDAVLLRAMADEAGALPYSSYYCDPSFLGNEEALRGFVRAHVRALTWIRQHTAGQIWDLIAPDFSGEDTALLAAAVERYHDLKTWHSDATIPQSSFAKLAGTLSKGGLIQRIPPYELVCNDLIAREAEARLGG
jgi:NitT/TauT family transport system substrate-binding protein